MASSDIRSGRLPGRPATPTTSPTPTRPLTPVQARIEAERCYYCFDAPCTAACPTGIDIPSFIRRIAEDNLRGAARAILEENVFGGMCARVCPTEVLCEQACVRNTNEDKPVEIGLLQRHATDHLMAHPGTPLFARAPATGKRVAVVGAGPAGLACAHRLALLGHDVVVFDAQAQARRPERIRPRQLQDAGRLRAEGDRLAARRSAASRSGTGQALGRDAHARRARAEFDAVFLAIGLAGVNALGLPGETSSGVEHAVDFIAAPAPGRATSRRCRSAAACVVIGGGMTAVDAAVQSRRLGAEEVTIVYRRGQAQMPASSHEQAWAQSNGVLDPHLERAEGACRRPTAQCRSATFAAVREEDGRLVETGETWPIDADMVFKAIGQTLEPRPLAGIDAARQGASVVDAAAAARSRRRRLGRRRLHLRRARPDGRRRRARQDRRPLDRPRAARRHPPPRARRMHASAACGLNRATTEPTHGRPHHQLSAASSSPNPFWLASAPPTDKEDNVVRAFEAGWGGVVWKTLGEDPPIVNVNGPRYGALYAGDRRLIGFNNIELITDRPLQLNLDEIRRVKRNWPDRAVVVSLMVPCEEAAWKRILPRVEDTGCDGIELNFGCPHGMSERGMGSAVGQVPEYIEMVTRWCKQYSRLPVIVKLTPNITDIRHPARAAQGAAAPTRCR